MDNTGTHDWYTVLTFGGGSQPRGPWRGQDAADAALDRWASRKGATAGSVMAATNARVAGPFCSRAAARDADISDYPRYLCRHGAE